MAITRTQIAKQLLANGGRIGLRRGSYDEAGLDVGPAPQTYDSPAQNFSGAGVSPVESTYDAPTGAVDDKFGDSGRRDIFKARTTNLTGYDEETGVNTPPEFTVIGGGGGDGVVTVNDLNTLYRTGVPESNFPGVIGMGMNLTKPLRDRTLRVNIDYFRGLENIDRSMYPETVEGYTQYMKDRSAGVIDAAGNPKTRFDDDDSKSDFIPIDTAGDGLDLSSTEFSVDLKSNGGLVIESTEVAVDLGASSITGTLDETDGGTGLTGYTAGDVIYASGTDTLAKLAKGSAGQVLTMNSGATAPEWSSDSDTTYSAGTLLDLATTTFNVDLSEASEAAIADGDYVMFLDGGASGTAAKEAIGDIATLFAGTGLTASSSVIGVDTSQNITALTGGDLTIYEDANNADVSVKMGTSATESLTIEVLNGGSNKTAEQINFTTATASTTANHGKMVFNVDETEIATIDDGGIDLASGMEFSVNGTAIGGSATALIDGDSDFTLADGVANGIHYELDNTDMADWNQGGVALTTAGGIFTHHQTQASTYTVAANTGSVLAGPITITGTVTNNGTMVVV